MATEWYYAQGGRQQGPVGEDQLQNLAHSGQLRPDDLVWNASMPDWQPARQLAFLWPADPGPGYAPAPGYAQPGYAQQGYPAGPQSVLGYQSPYGDISATGRSIEMLRQTKPWVRFVGVLLIVFACLFFLLALFGIGGMASMPGMEAMWGIACVYVVLAILFHLIPGILLNQYASRIADLLGSRQPRNLETALEAQKTFWRYVGIVALVIVIIYAILFAFIIATGAGFFRPF